MPKTRPRRLNGKRILLLIEAAVCLSTAKLLIHTIPFHLLARTIGQRNVESPYNASESGSRAMAEIGWALRAIGRRIGLLQQCLAQAIAAQWMARRRNLSSTVYLGTRRDVGGLSAHAWLRAGDRFIVGGEGRAAHHVIAAFGDQ